MRNEEPIDLARRRVMQAVLALPAVTFIGCGGGAEAVSPTAPAQPATIPATPACDDGDDDPTPAETEGPYFKPNSPERRNLVESGLAGTPLTITGQVLTTACVPIAAALLDFWQADNAGAYDLTGFRLRGHQLTDAEGRFTLTTIVPGLYPGRTRHIHVKAQAPNKAVLTTQLYFPGEARNSTDGLYRADLLLSIPASGSGVFNFVLA
jgi:protocatechuate 3,4-dioxygenase beta subunit